MNIATLFLSCALSLPGTTSQKPIDPSTPTIGQLVRAEDILPIDIYETISFKGELTAEFDRKIAEGA